MESQALFAQLNQNLAGGKLNDAFLLAAQRMPFWIENVEFLKLLGITLDSLGFAEESRSVTGFATRLVEHRARFAEKNQREASEYDERGHSHPYRVSGLDPQWIHPVWDRRAQMVAALLPADARVLDLGCGAMLVERYLAPTAAYVPCDVDERDERTIVCDFDKKEYPEDVGETHVVCLGVMPYLQQQLALFEHICSRGKPFLVTLKPQELVAAKVERGVFPPAIPLAEVNRIATGAGFAIGIRHVLGQGDELLITGVPQA